MTANMVNPLAGVFPSPASPLTALIDARATLVGGVYHLSFDEALIVTNDYDKIAAGGIAKHAFLLAAAVDPRNPASSPVDDDEILLLRVKEVAQLPDQAELVETRLAAMRDASERLQVPYSAQVLDPFTQHQIAKCAYRCDILGTFYTDAAVGQPYVEWGSDVDNVYAAARYFVFAPGPDALRFIASYPLLTGDEIAAGVVPATLPIGKVRYSATRRRSKVNSLDAVPVEVRVADFVEGRKTAVFGMTRAGKSNSMKTIATAVYEYAARTGQQIGQLIFDPQGEYAKVNQQDKTGLRLLGAHAPNERVKIYKLKPDPSLPEEKPLAINFFDTGEFPMVWGLIQDAVGRIDAAYAKDFMSAAVLEPDPADFATPREFEKARTDAGRGRLALYALLADVGYRAPSRFRLTFTMDKPVADAFKAAFPTNSLAQSNGRGTIASPSDANELMRWLVQELEASNPIVASWDRCEPFTHIRHVYDKSRGTSVRANINALGEFHDPTASGNLTDKVWEDMQAGRIVVIDLSVGSEEVTKRLSERLVWGMLSKANDRFRNNQPNVQMQILVEEAHVLFDRKKGEGKAAAEDPWVTLAKQSAKYEMGLVYATQEVTSVDRRILSNTANWLVAHLNSDGETNELSHYYDFRAFADDIRSSEDRGFVRMKTFSGKYIVPVQIEKFDHVMVNKARQAAGDPPVNPDGTLQQVP